MKKIIVKQPTTDCVRKEPSSHAFFSHLCREKLNTQLLKELAQGCRGSVWHWLVARSTVKASYLVELDYRDGIVPSLRHVATNISSNLTKWKVQFLTDLASYISAAQLALLGSASALNHCTLLITEICFLLLRVHVCPPASVAGLLPWSVGVSLETRFSASPCLYLS